MDCEAGSQAMVGPGTMQGQVGTRAAGALPVSPWPSPFLLA